jgi:hypothetical protein
VPAEGTNSSQDKYAGDFLRLCYFDHLGSIDLLKGSRCFHLGSTVGQKNQLLVINTVIFPSLLGIMKLLAELISKPSASVLLYHQRKPYGIYTPGEEMRRQFLCCVRLFSFCTGLRGEGSTDGRKNNFSSL